MSSNPSFVSSIVAYILWALGFLGLCGLHRFYLGEPISGLIWLFTFGFLFIGQFIDLFLMPDMIQNRNSVLEEKDQGERLLSDNAGQSFLQGLFPFQTAKKNTQLMQKLLKAASDNGNVLSVGQAIMLTGFSADEVQELLTDALRKGIAQIDNESESGAIRYYFDI